MPKTITLFAATLLVCLPSCKKGESTAASSDADAAVSLPAPAVAMETISAKQPVSFNEHIQPILSANCYHCHGPDSGSRMPEDQPLRLDREVEAFAKRENGKPVIIKGNPDESYLIALIESKDKDEVMPPDPSVNPHGKVMKPAEIALLRRWIKEGAVFEDHWAYIAPKKSELPQIKNKDWARNPVDFFVADQFEKRGLAPEADEEKPRLLRRLFLDLTGLPPTPEELAAITADKRDFDTVYLETVNKLLASDAYAEEWTRHWLDVARYGDTHGIHNDNYRSIWPYRDWVISAFRENMPFDEFTRQQIAGDMFPTPTQQQLVATGFNRCMPTTGEGGSIIDEVNATYAQERVDTTSSAWLGLTMGCAACHDHKFDAISTKENYEFTAFFRNTTMAALDGNKADHPPSINATSPLDVQKAVIFDARIAAAQKQYDDAVKAQEPAFQTWLASNKELPATPVPAESQVLSINLADPAQAAVDTKGTAYVSEKPLVRSPGHVGEAVNFAAGNSIDLGAQGDFERTDAFTCSALIKVTAATRGAFIAKMDMANGYRGYDIQVLAGGLLNVHLINVYPANTITVRTTTPMPLNAWSHAAFSYDGSGKAAGVKIYVNGLPAPTQIFDDRLSATMKTTVPLRLGKRQVDNPYNGELQGVNLFNKSLSAAEMVSHASKMLGKELLASTDPAVLAQALRDYYFSQVDTTASKLKEGVAAITAEKAAAANGAAITLVMQENPKAKPTANILIRGQYANKDKEVLSPTTPASLPPMTDAMPKNRLGLAMWLTDPGNPLPARVTVNRYWYYFFGNGIVSSTNDFGVMGARPTHPKLLDWLAVDFVENKWDLHHLVRTIVTSSTYRQNGSISEAKLEADPDNLFLSRGPRYRMDAEQIRDLTLASSGLLQRRLGGPSVKPYQPANIWESVAMSGSNTRDYKQDTGNNLYRRSMYTFWKRIAPHPAMEILNAPVRDMSCVRRDLTNTPLQAFVIMNDPQFVEASRRLAELALKAEKTYEARIDFISTRLIARPMDAEEHKIISGVLADSMKAFTATPANATQLIKVGESPADATLDPTELAAWSLVANQIFNMDENLNK